MASARLPSRRRQCGPRVPALGLALVAFLTLSCGGSRPTESTSRSGDRDDDTVADGTDACPDDPEDLDAFRDRDGCPDCDHDIDWVTCSFDETRGHCPGATAEDPDGDGIARGDECPEIPEDGDGRDDGDGCPEPDDDFDCVLDAGDACPDRPGPVSANGCPAVR